MDFESLKTSNSGFDKLTKANDGGISEILYPFYGS